MKIPGVGRKTAEDLIALGYDSVGSLAGEDPKDMYFRLCMMQDGRSDRCNLYIYRCAVYFAENLNKKKDPNLLLWWNWKD
ncbi:MAG: pathogenicity locus [Methanomicrobiaceae archaeon]|nr:pathogenicity locus [Methanomicrobiaceae archaeon]